MESWLCDFCLDEEGKRLVFRNNQIAVDPLGELPSGVRARSPPKPQPALLRRHGSPLQPQQLPRPSTVTPTPAPRDTMPRAPTLP